MLKRLIIAVFGISLVLAFGSIVLAGPGGPPQIQPDPQAGPYFNTSHPRYNTQNDARPVQPTFKKPSSALRLLPTGLNTPAPPSSIYFCDLQDYSNPAATSLYYWTIPDAYGDDLFNSRFTVEANFECTLKTVYLLMLSDGSLVGPTSWGSPDMRVYLWADDGFGFPGALLDSVDIPFASIPGFGYVNADFSAASWVFADGDEYHYGYTTLGGPSDTLAILSDLGDGPYSGEERSSEYYAGAWGSMLNDWGVDVAFIIISDRCCNEIPFSDCYSQSYHGGAAFFWTFPDPTFGDTSYAMRFDVGGPETLQSVDVRFYGGGGAGGDEAVHVTIYDDDGFGLPGAQVAQVTLPGSSYPLFPAYANVSFAPLVLNNTFHVAVSSDGVPGVSYEAIISDNGSFGAGRGSGSGTYLAGWGSSLALYGGDYNWHIIANLCRDEFSDCSVQDYYGAGDGPTGTDLAMPNSILKKFAQRFTNAPGGEECELRQLFFRLSRLPADVGRPLMYTKNTYVTVVADAGGEPAATPPIYSATLTPADYAAAGYNPSTLPIHLYFTLNPNVAVPGNYWVVFESEALIRAEGVRVGARIVLPDPAGVLDWCKVYYDSNDPDEGWYIIDDVFGGAQTHDAALDVEATVCCIPFSGRVCAPAGDDWSSRSHDLARTGASQLAIGDAWCDLNLNAVGFHDDLNAAASAQTMGPIIYEGRVFQILETAAAGSSIRVFNLATGASEGTISGAALGNFAENDPLIVNDKLYVCGGDNRVVSRWDVSGAIPALPDWTRTTAGGQPLRRTNLLLVDVAGTLVLFGGTQVGTVFAINESDGLNYPGWGGTNPITLDAGQLVQASATDGVRLYFGTFQGGLFGDVWAINPANGAVVWKLSTAGGYQAQTQYTPTVTSESFTNISVESDVLYVGGRLTGNFPVDGTFYRLNATNGAFLSVAGTNGAIFSNPIIDVNLVYLPTLTRWLPPNSNLPGDLFAFSKTTGALVWGNQDYYELSGGPSYFANALLTCEPEPDVDIIVGGNRHGGLHFWRSLDGTELFRRTVDFGPTVYPSGPFSSAIGGTAIGTDALGDVHVLVSTLRGALIDLTKGADRPRLEIQDFDPTIAVEFSVLTSVLYTVPDIITNTGCLDLLFNAVNVDTLPFGSSDPYIAPFTPVRPDLLDAATMLANEMADNAAKFKNAQENEVFEFSNNYELLASSEESQRHERNYRAALAIPAYLNSVVSPFAGQVVAAGDSIDLVLDVNPSNINRGPQKLYIELDTDDPDYFLNEASVALPNAFPELVVTLVGGCLTDTTRLIFGVGSTDFQIVSNTTRLADSDWPETGWAYQGNPASSNTPIFQGTYIFGVSKERIAMNVKNWFGQPEANSWFSVQGDPNFCDNSCKPALFTGVGLGTIWNGSAYAPVVGSVVAKSWVDSVQDYGFGTLADWDWRNYGAPFSDSLTMGLSANTVTIGVPNSAPFDNFTVEIFEVTNRNSTAADTIPGWKFGANIDYDASHFYHGAGHDTLILDRSISATWSTSLNPAVQFAYGLVKLPFGCGYEPMVSAMGLDADQGHFEDVAGRGDPYWDSAYFYLSLAPGTERSHILTSTPNDEQSHSTMLWHYFQPGETIKFAAVNFGLSAGVSAPHANGGGGAIADLANFANKWVGFGRGDVNDDDAVNLGDIMVLADIVGGSVPGAIPFEHLADVDADGDVDVFDLDYLIDYYFDCGACPRGDWVLDVTCP